MKTIQYKVSYEKMISRLSGLFAYLEADDFGELSLHYATDSLNGCYGKIIENIQLPKTVNLMVDGINILKGGEVYSFRTIIAYYYANKMNLTLNEAFKNFVEKAIGKIKVDGIKGNAVPKFIYLSNAREIYNELVKISKQCSFYEKNREKFGFDKHLCCLCERYDAMGGDAFKDFIEQQIPKAEEIAKEYYEYALNAQNAKKPMTLDFDIDLTSSFEDLGIMSPYVSEWMPYKKYYSGDIVYYDGKIWIAKHATTGYWNEETEKVIFDTDAFTLLDNGMSQIQINKNQNSPIGNFRIEGYTDSKLKELRRSVTYLNDNNEEERPDNGKDWLFYYRKGMVINSKTLNNSLGNVEANDGNSYTYKSGSTYCTNLMAYGDVIEDITTDVENNTITFIYRLGVHLIAQRTDIAIDDDGNELYKWGSFEWDKNEKIGVKYDETYNYVTEGELYNLINGKIKISDITGNANDVGNIDFNDYVTGKYDNRLKNYKFEFITYNNRISYQKLIANQNANIVSEIGNFDIYRKDFDEFVNSQLVRQDYFNGITYSPTKDIDVHIERGTTSVFQKCISLSQVKSMEDFETFQNSSFFKLNKG